MLFVGFSGVLLGLDGVVGGVGEEREVRAGGFEL